MGNYADKVKTTQDNDGMLRRALERIIQLYTDKSHFVYELLQNAEDAEATIIKFAQYDDRLEVLHNGRPFTLKNLQGLCDIGKSDKVDDLNQIGEFGVGFKSVFGICDTVRLYSTPQNYKGPKDYDADPFAVEITDFVRPEDISDEPMDSSYTTRFIFPFIVGKTFSGFTTKDALKKTLSKKLQNLGITTLLFMKNLTLIEYEIENDGEPIIGEYLLDKKDINDHCSLVSALGNSNAKISTNDEISYLKFSRRIGENSLRTVDIAFSVSVDKDGNYECQQPKNPYVSVYFPTETESKLNFIVQGPYRTTPNRSSIPSDDIDNKMLAKETAILLQDAIRELKTARKLNMSFLKVLPVNQRNFDNFNLFYPLYETVRHLFSSEELIPCKYGNYVSASYAKIARQEKLALLFGDELLSSLIRDGNIYRWLPTFLTETNREYEHIYRFLTGELSIEVIRPEDLRTFFASNSDFLPQRDNSWIVDLYQLLENVGAAFSKLRNESNMLTAEIIKTSDDRFVAAFRKTEGNKYIPNVFLPSNRITSNKINFVNMPIYEKCRHFFDDVLQLQKPNEYEFIINDISKRYNNDYSFIEDKHIEDIKYLLKYWKYDDYKEEVTKVIKDCIVLRCNDSVMRRPFSVRVFLPINEKGQQIEAYYRNVVKNIFYVDIDYYSNHGITSQDLSVFGVRNSILTGETIAQGIYYNGTGGRQPEWWTPGEFRWKLSLESIKDVLKYISEHPTAKDSLIKSQTVFCALMDNEAKLCGSVRISGSTPNLDNEPCELVSILRGEKSFSWDGKWLFTESGELVSQKNVSKHDISVPIYGRIKADSIVYELLAFRKTEADEVDDLKKTISKKQLDAFFETELKQRFGITTADLSEKFGSTEDRCHSAVDEDSFLFPIARVKNWETLKKHAAEMLLYANPVKYEYAIRSIRVSNSPKEVKAYLHNMYRYDGVYKYACQLCHNSCSNIESTQLFNNPDAELDPMNLCLCPNCASRYRLLRNNDKLMDTLTKSILNMGESEVTNGDQVIIPIENQEIWFTQTHFAEIQELLRLKIDVKQNKSDKPSIIVDDSNTGKSGLSVYAEYIEKHIRRKDGFMGKITNVDADYLYVFVEQGVNSGTVTKIALKFFLESLHSVAKVYEILD